ncbi:glycine cleavage system protein H, partial [bacterium]|nr:glycine cleavage system protein H [bacterium]
PYGKGWMLKVRTSNLKSEIDNLLTPEAYEALLR